MSRTNTREWLESVAKAAQTAPTSRQTAPEPPETSAPRNTRPQTAPASQSRTEAYTASTRAALIAAIDAGTTAKALTLALQAISALTGDSDPLTIDAQSRAAMGEEWRRAYKAWTTHAPRIRAAQTAPELDSAYSDAIDACMAIATDTGEDGFALGEGVLNMFEELYKARVNRE